MKKQTNLIITLVFVINIFSYCSDDNNIIKDDKLDANDIKPGPSGPTLNDSNKVANYVSAISDRSILYFSPDSVELDDIKSKQTESDFDEVAFDITYYTAQLIDFSNKRNLKLYTSHEKVFYYKCKNDSFRIDISQLDSKWGAIAYDTCRKPEFIALEGCEESLITYFGIK